MKYILRIQAFVLCSLLLINCNSNEAVEILDLFPVSIEGKFQYIDREGNVAIQPQFSSASVFRENLALVAVDSNKKWGFINKEGSFVIPPIYKSATSFSEGIAWVVKENHYPEAIDTKGNVIFKAEDALVVGSFTDGLARYKTIRKNKVQWGFLNTKGDVSIKPQFEGVDFFVNGICAVNYIYGDSMYPGYINKKGEIISKEKGFYQIDRFSFGKARVVDISSCTEDTCYPSVIDEKMNLIFNTDKLKYKNITVDRIGYKIYDRENKFGWCDTSGKYLIKPQFKRAYSFLNNDLASVSLDNEKWGYIDKLGKMVIEPIYDETFDFNGNLGFVKLNNKVGAINENGKIIINPIYDSIHPDYHFVQEKFSYYNTVESEYLNVNKIFDNINVYQPGNLPWLSQINEFLNKYQIKTGDVNLKKQFFYNSEEGYLRVFSSDYNFYYYRNGIYKHYPTNVRKTNISGQAELNLFIYSSNLTKSKVDSLGTDEVLNDEAVIDRVDYQIKFYNKKPDFTQNALNQIIQYIEEKTDYTQLVGGDEPYDKYRRIFKNERERYIFVNPKSRVKLIIDLDDDKNINIRFIDYLIWDFEEEATEVVMEEASDYVVGDGDGSAE